MTTTPRLFIAECVDEDRSSFRAHSWITTESNARRYFDMVLSYGAELRLIGHGGRILAVRPEGDMEQVRDAAKAALNGART